MPTYSYRCSDCGHAADLFLPIRKMKRKTKCPKCGAATFRNIVTGQGGAGVVVPGCRLEYPHYNHQLPLQPGQVPGKPNVESRQHLRELCAKHDLRYDQ